jgi:predicted site-specific integrase-resolvase
MTAPELEPLMTSAEVAELFRVDVGTVGRWRREGRLMPVPTPGGRPRYDAAMVRALLAGEEPKS